jgi:hypothetical protein
MPFRDFLKNFPYFCLCAVSENISSLHLNMHEDQGVCGPLCGVGEGLVSYCACCEGAKQLWFPEERSTLELINAFKDDTTLERIEKCCCPNKVANRS